MKINKAIMMLIGVMAFDTIAVQAQDLFRVKFRATCRPDNGNKDSRRLTERDLIEQCVGTGFSKKELRRDFELVYNPSADSLQVVNEADGSHVCDVFQFQGGTNVVGSDELTRFVFVFVPGQADAIGSAVITEKPNTGNSSSNGVTRARISAKIQFTMAEETGGETNTAEMTAPVSDNSDTNSSSTNIVFDVFGDANSGVSDSLGSFVQASAVASVATAANVQVCSGNFSAGRLFVADSDQNGVGESTPEDTSGSGGTSDSTVTDDTGTTIGTTNTNITTIVSTNGTLIVTTNSSRTGVIPIPR
jgi:hypothetical protein